MDYGAYYSNLIIWQYRNKPKAKTLISNLIDTMQLFDGYGTFADAFQVNTAVGFQLRTIGQFVGLPNAFDINALPDSQYRQLVYFQIIVNNSNSSEGQIVDALWAVFGADLIIKTTNQMNMNAYANLPNDMLQIAITYNLIPRPMGVQLNIININQIPFYFTDSTNIITQIGIDSIGGNGNSALTSTNNLIT